MKTIVGEVYEPGRRQLQDVLTSVRTGSTINVVGCDREVGRATVASINIVVSLRAFLSYVEKEDAGRPFEKACSKINHKQSFDFSS